MAKKPMTMLCFFHKKTNAEDRKPQKCLLKPKGTRKMLRINNDFAEALQNLNSQSKRKFKLIGIFLSD